MDHYDAILAKLMKFVKNKLQHHCFQDLLIAQEGHFQPYIINKM